MLCTEFFLKNRLRKLLLNLFGRKVLSRIMNLLIGFLQFILCLRQPFIRSLRIGLCCLTQIVQFRQVVDVVFLHPYQRFSHFLQIADFDL